MIHHAALAAHQVFATVVQAAPARSPEKGVDWATWITAAATVVLTAATVVLAIFTRQLFTATRSPAVVVTIEPNARSIRHLDLHMHNEGTAAAYDIKLTFSPPMPLRDGFAHGPPPLSDVAVLRAGQKLTSFLNDFEALATQPYEVLITWRDQPKGKSRVLAYTIDLQKMLGFNQLGEDPAIQLAEETKKIREALVPVLTGHRRLEVDAYDALDRLRERRAHLRRWRRAERRQLAQSSAPVNEASPAGDQQPGDIEAGPTEG